MVPWLQLWPNQQMAVLLFKGFGEGFPLPSFQGLGCLINKNLPSIDSHIPIVAEKILKEVQEGRVAGPFLSPPFANFRISPLGIIPKKEPNSFRMIHHLSYPFGSSLNDDIDAALCSVSYSSFDDALTKIRKLGHSALLAKADIKSAFRLLPIHPTAFNSLGFYFNNSYYFDKCLPMGCSLSCRYFEMFSSFLEWVVSYQSGSANLLHYLDDFIFMGPADSDECIYLFTEFQCICRLFGVPLAHEKSVLPTTCLEFLGVTIDTDLMQFRLPPQKIAKLLFLVDFVMSKKKVVLRTLQSLLGLLAFASRVIPMGRVFSKRLYRSISGIKSPYHFVRITASLRADLLVWKQFLSSFNGCSFWQEPFCTSEALNLFTDAAGAVGYGAYWQGHWSASKWPSSWIDNGLTVNITLLEIFPVLISLELWGSCFSNRRILLHSDNKAVVYAINCLSSKSLPVLAVLRQLVLKCLELNIWLKAKYVPGIDNSVADSLSRLQLDRFRMLVPEADTCGVRCPSQLWDLVF